MEFYKLIELIEKYHKLFYNYESKKLTVEI